MENNAPVPVHAIIGDVFRTLTGVAEHASFSQRICLFKVGNDESYYVTEEEWLEGVARYEEIAREQETVTRASPTADKLGLFRSLFRGREDVYAHGFLNNRTNKIGYCPACAHERTQLCPRYTLVNRKQACSDCEARSFLPFTNRVLLPHMTEVKDDLRNVLGLYVMTKDNKTWVLVADFDKEGWQRESALYCKACTAHGLTPALERSRSGNGAHVWLFFEEAVDASLARNLGATLISWAMSHGTGIGFASYDRFFPTQDTLSKDGLGNLIALPLQGRAMLQGNSMFVDENFEPYPDQWLFLSSVTKVSEEKAKEIVASSEAGPLGSLCSGTKKSTDDSKPIRLKGQQRLKREDVDATDFPTCVVITKANMLYVSKEGISARGQNRLRRLAAFANPGFFEAQAMRRYIAMGSVPRIIYCGEEDEDFLALPRGCEDDLIALLKETGVEYEIIDERMVGKPISVEFMGSLRESQPQAVAALLAEDCGILKATPSFGKTVVGAHLVATLKLPTLIIVHTADLISQWVDRLETFLTIEDTREPLLTKSGRPSRKKRPVIGQIGAGKNCPSGIVDVATYQSLVTKDDLGIKVAKPLVEDYGLVIADECHHTASTSFEIVMRAVRAKYVFGLSATPERRDRLDNVVFMLCGPIRYETDQEELAQAQGFQRLLRPRFTKIRLKGLEPDSSYNEIVDKLGAHEARNRLIVADVVASVAEGHTPIVLTKRKAHVTTLATMLEEAGVRVFVLTGDVPAKERRKTIATIGELGDVPFAIVATGGLVGEGFDLPRLDTLVLAAPYSWEGVITQFVGRIHRKDEGKTEATVYDYVDTSIPLLGRMYKKRLKAYRKNLYEIVDPEVVEGDGATLVGSDSWNDALMSDIQGAGQSVLIVAPRAGMAAVETLLPALKDAASRGVPVTIVVARPSSDDARERLDAVFERLQEAGCTCRQEVCQQTGIAVIDGATSWYGTLPLLAKPDQDDCSLRITSAEVAADILTGIGVEL